MENQNEKEYTLLETWRGLAYASQKTQRESDMFWANYFNLEKGIYEQILATPDTVVTGTVKELASKYNVELLIMVGFLDGINDSLKNPNPIEEMTEDTEVNLGYDIELLYKNMVEAKAEWLYTLDAWNSLIPDENRRKELYKEQKSSHTVVKDKKIGRNEPCPCGSGKKYKFCCGK
ncbi:MAG: SEC-C domain-containing protein [Lachnospiraceae bacterium]|nr:SEC-C domain-containing protein [Lachnospiraceae bacterium]